MSELHPMSLKNLTMPFTKSRLDEIEAEIVAEHQVYKDKYGDDWEKYWDADQDRDIEMTGRRSMNTLIYHQGDYSKYDKRRIPGHMLEELDARRRELYGDQYDELMLHRVDCDPRVAELLIQEAIQTGEWEVLPRELVSEYRKRVGMIE